MISVDNSPYINRVILMFPDNRSVCIYISKVRGIC